MSATPSIAYWEAEAAYAEAQYFLGRVSIDHAVDRNRAVTNVTLGQAPFSHHFVNGKKEYRHD